MRFASTRSGSAGTRSRPKLWIKTVTLGKNDGEGKEVVDVNNDSLVLREVLKQLSEIREHQERERGNEKQAMDNGPF